MSEDASWIDDVIKQHKKQLDDLKNKKNTIDDNFIPNQNNIQNQNNQIGKLSTNFDNKIIESSQKFDTIYEFNNNKNYFNPNQNEKNISHSQGIMKEEINNEEEKLKEEIEKLKKENEILKIENETLKKNINELTSQKLNNYNLNNNNVDIDKYKNIIEQLNTQLNKMEEDKDNNEKKFKQLENMKNKEIELMNQKIKNFEIIIDENTQNYLNEIKMLKLQIQNNKSKLEECNKYVEIVNFFINKIDYIFGIQSKQIYDIDELKSKFEQIENLIQKILNKNNQNKINNNYNITNDNKIHSFNNSKISDENLNDKVNQNEEIKDENKSYENDMNNENYNQLKVPHFQNEILEQGLCNNHQITNREEDKYKIFKNLEQRIIDLEKKIYHSPKKDIQNNNKIKKNHKSNINQNKIIYTNTHYNNEKNNSKNKVLRSKSSGKINYEKQNSNQIQYKNSNSNQINYNPYKKGKKTKKTQRKKNSTNKHENSTCTLNNNNDNYSISNSSTYSNLKNNLAK